VKNQKLEVIYDVIFI